MSKQFDCLLGKIWRKGCACWCSPCSRGCARTGSRRAGRGNLLRLLAQFRAEDAAKEGYGPANVLSLLKELRGHLRGLNISRLSIRGTYLQGVELQDTTLAFALMRECVWTSTFRCHLRGSH